MILDKRNLTPGCFFSWNIQPNNTGIGQTFLCQTSILNWHVNDEFDNHLPIPSILMERLNSKRVLKFHFRRVRIWHLKIRSLVHDLNVTPNRRRGIKICPSLLDCPFLYGEVLHTWIWQIGTVGKDHIICFFYFEQMAESFVFYRRLES